MRHEIHHQHRPFLRSTHSLDLHRDFTDYHRILAAMFLMAQYVVIAGSLEFGFLTPEKKRLKKS